MILIIFTIGLYIGVNINLDMHYSPKHPQNTTSQSNQQVTPITNK